MNHVERLKRFTEHVSKPGVDPDTAKQAFKQFEANEVLRNPSRTAEFFLNSVILCFDYEHDRVHSEFAAHHLKSGIITQEIFGRAVNEEVLLRSVAVLLYFQRNANETYYQELIQPISDRTALRMNEQMPCDRIVVTEALERYVEAFRKDDAVKCFAEAYLYRIVGDDVSRAYLMRDGRWITGEFKFVADLFVAVRGVVEKMATPPLLEA